jgi:BirA family biotin operon repressor/biotin-[acetyl-CoA-carboxylase] ligase
LTDRQRQILAALADGEFHSGQRLAESAGVTRSAVWKQIKRLTRLGLEVEGITGKGYRLSSPLEMLDRENICHHLDAAAKGVPVAVEVLFETGSTNQYLLDSQAGGSMHGRAVLAEYQFAGRGRGKNLWLSAPASGLCLSLGWHYESIPGSLTSLSLATGVILAEVLQEMGCGNIRLKWPNDVVVNGAKLAGILIESRAQGAGPCDIVIGVGINVHLPARLEQDIGRQVTDLRRLLAPAVPSRNVLAARLINKLINMLGEYDSDGFVAFKERWRRLDYTAGKNAILLQSGQQSSGRVVGIDENGLLIMSINGESRKFSSGELSLRLLE